MCQLFLRYVLMCHVLGLPFCLVGRSSGRQRLESSRIYRVLGCSPNTMFYQPIYGKLFELVSQCRFSRTLIGRFTSSRNLVPFQVNSYTSSFWEKYILGIFCLFAAGNASWFLTDWYMYGLVEGTLVKITTTTRYLVFSPWIQSNNTRIWYINNRIVKSFKLIKLFGFLEYLKTMFIIFLFYFL